MPTLVDVVDVLVDLVGHLHGLERVLVTAAVFPCRVQGHTGGDAQRPHPVIVGEQRVRAVRQEETHQLVIDALGRQQIRRRPDPVELGPVSVGTDAVAGHPRVDIGPHRDQFLRQVHAAHRAGRHRVRHLSHRQRANADDLVQSRPATLRRIRVRATVQQVRRQLEVRVDDRDDDAVHAVGQLLVGVDTGVKEQLDRRLVPGANRKEERREADGRIGRRRGG